MQVILLSNVKGTGQKDQLIKVSDGYAKNFLLPKKLAKEATKQTINELKLRKESKEHKIKLEKEKALKISKSLERKTIKIFAKSGKDNKIFGSVTRKEIMKALKNSENIIVDKRKIDFPNVKTFGTYNCKIQLFSGIFAKILVNISNESEQ
ncbi:MAG: 50S ribosomal protein L9 [Oscillospiraceae bacterium]|jgi:large subunit ribosomal protein L9|nr:50S ribosomal protein L9 [Oscillospiraceae bacterium]